MMMPIIITITTTYYLTLAFIDDVAVRPLAILFIHYFLTSPTKHFLLLPHYTRFLAPITLSSSSS